METTPITGLDEFDKHLDDLVQDPALTLNPKLFDDVELQLTEANIPPLIPRFLPRLTAILKQYNENPAAIVSLTIKLLGPVSFTEVLQLASPDELVQALDSPAPAPNILAMTVFHKAAARPADVATLSNLTHLVAAFIHRWLAAPYVEVGEKGSKVLGDLLDVDCELPPPPPTTRPTDAAHTELVIRKAPGQGRLWRLLFNDRATYGLLLDLISGRHPDTAGDYHQLSLAQGRVLRILPRLASIDFRAVSRSPVTTPPTPVHLTNGQHDSEGGGGGEGEQPSSDPPRPGEGEGLLQFAALRMVRKADVLMHLSLVDFFEALVSLMRVTEDSPAKVETLRALLAEATAGDDVLREALLSLPDRTVEEEADDLRRWLQEVMPGDAVRLAVR
ncbi:61a8a08f-8f2a-48d0-9934-d0611c07d27e [Thermothielavioides terrestris]|uniref:DNA mismatch repair protein HSM3 N-terminal domain-containing protein n=2 Tax=Thermothielavioides terrestris TaxID=2587410 RepID=G2R0B9_THETT|nr:uncharacterized protein THITE_2116186 [Thermothielavioides terrestris NRRL 8126]AEO67287.1 hypothetical protein THITE_2116186 [Thermothielavioides terrestris NRRL 8126]SPQ23999.1 61a8a08f-8f2a-48d0-9934-d0611c07d27e [Thermothielavioides terrestris]